MFVLLTMQFCSYLQPFMITAVILFGWIGVVIAHWLFGLWTLFLTLFVTFAVKFNHKGYAEHKKHTKLGLTG